jgi:hypothetical protein
MYHGGPALQYLCNSIPVLVPVNWYSTPSILYQWVLDYEYNCTGTVLPCVR